jgi:hypothetical protein
MRTTKLKLLTDKYFLLGLVILLCNDIVFKYQFSGLITGKLSDVSGLFIFPFFWSIFFERNRKEIYLLTIVLFIFWKLPISTSFISSINLLLGTWFSRTIDYTDLFTLAIVPISYRYSKIKAVESTKQESSWTVSKVVISVTAVFAFIATTLPRHRVDRNVNINETYTFSFSKAKLFTDMMPATPLTDDNARNMVDSLFYLEFNSINGDILAELKIYEIGKEQTIIEFISVKYHIVTGGLFSGLPEREIKKIKKLTRDDYLNAFNDEVVDKVDPNDYIQTQISYWNPKLDSRIIDEN